MATKTTALDSSCGNSGYLSCWCGGDFCACSLYGVIECPGCEDCEPTNENEDDENE